MHLSKRGIKVISKNIEEKVGAEGKAKSCFGSKAKLTLSLMRSTKIIIILNPEKAIRRAYSNIKIKIARHINLVFYTDANWQ